MVPFKQQLPLSDVTTKEKEKYSIWGKLI